MEKSEIDTHFMQIDMPTALETYQCLHGDLEKPPDLFLS